MPHIYENEQMIQTGQIVQQCAMSAWYFQSYQSQKIFVQGGSNACSEMKVVSICVCNIQFSLWYSAHVQF